MNQIYLQKVGLRERSRVFQPQPAVEVQPVLNLDS